MGQLSSTTGAKLPEPPSRYSRSSFSMSTCEAAEDGVGGMRAVDELDVITLVELLWCVIVSGSKSMGTDVVSMISVTAERKMNKNEAKCKKIEKILKA